MVLCSLHAMPQSIPDSLPLRLPSLHVGNGGKGGGTTVKVSTPKLSNPPAFAVFINELYNNVCESVSSSDSKDQMSNTEWKSDVCISTISSKSIR